MEGLQMAASLFFDVTRADGDINAIAIIFYCMVMLFITAFYASRRDW